MIKLSEIEKITGVGALVYGSPGVGKTYALRTLKGKVLNLDCENGYDVLAGEPVDMTIIHIEPDNMASILNSPKINEFNVIVLDNVTELYDRMLARQKAANSIPNQRNYLEVQYVIKEFLRHLLMKTRKGVHVIVNAWEQKLAIEQDDNSVRSEILPNIGKSLPAAICGMFSIVGRMEVSKKDPQKRGIRLSSTHNIWAKDRIFKRQFCAADAQELLTEAKADVPV